MTCLNNYLQFIKRTVTITPADWDAETKLAAVQADWAIAGMSATFAPDENSMNVFIDIAVQGVYCTNILNGDLLFKSGSGAVVTETVTLNVTAYNDGKGIIVNANIVSPSDNGISMTIDYDTVVENGNAKITGIQQRLVWTVPPYDDERHEITEIGSGTNISNANLIDELYLVNNVKRVNNAVFNGSTKLKKVYIGKQVTFIGDDLAFKGCSALEEIVFETPRTELLTIKTSVNIYNSTFGWNSTLKNVVIPPLVKLENYSFAYLSGLETVRYESAETPGVAFGNSPAKDLTFTQVTPVTVGANAPIFNSVQYIYVPYDSLTAYTTATNWTSYASYMYGIGKFTAGTVLPNRTTDGGFNLTWYATKADLKAGNNPITVAPSVFDNEYGEIYCANTVAE